MTVSLTNSCHVKKSCYPVNYFNWVLPAPGIQVFDFNKKNHLMTCCYVNYLAVQSNYCNNLGGGEGLELPNFQIREGTEFVNQCTCPNIVSQLRK
jgi:hypothetical protein